MCEMSYIIIIIKYTIGRHLVHHQARDILISLLNCLKKVLQLYIVKTILNVKYLQLYVFESKPVPNIGASVISRRRRLEAVLCGGFSPRGESAGAKRPRGERGMR